MFPPAAFLPPAPACPIFACVRYTLPAAMEAEAMPMVKALGLQPDDPPVVPPPAPCHSFSGEHGGAQVHVVCFGECRTMLRQLPLRQTGQLADKQALRPAASWGFYLSHDVRRRRRRPRSMSCCLAYMPT